ncbi:hypothetical protein P153DRAFT_410277, partial [Dothidotthia symphoricarpi CBS 119687]
MPLQDNTLHLSITDQITSRTYITRLLLFPFPDPAHASLATTALHTSLTATLHQHPILAGTLHLDPHTNRLVAHYPQLITPAHASLIFNISTTHISNPLLDFHTLQTAHFPPAHLPSQIFCPALLHNHPSLDDPLADGILRFDKGPVPVMAAQVTFIPGGLALSVYVLHSIVDGYGATRVCEAWARNIHALGGGGGYIDPSLARRALDALATDPGVVPWCPERRLLAPGEVERGMRVPPYRVQAEILRFRFVVISKLKADLARRVGTRVSPFVAIAALLQTHIAHARRAILDEHRITTTTLGVAVQHRACLGMRRGELGNCCVGAMATSPIPNAGSIAVQCVLPAVLAITHALGEIDRAWVLRRLAFLSHISHPQEVTSVYRVGNGPDLYITNLMHFGADTMW